MIGVNPVTARASRPRAGNATSRKLRARASRATYVPERTTTGPDTGPPGAPPKRQESIEHQDRARHLTGLHGAERLVHVLQPAALGDHLIEVQAALEVELDVAGHVDAEAVGTHRAALDLAFGQEGAAVQLHLLSNR